ncbi:MAG: DUF4214 domain-containing protein [Oscillospiraceae bacterium]|nr:DUF4214 domain-containing protein [Oscillospiraceae bacterium]
MKKILRLLLIFILTFTVIFSNIASVFAEQTNEHDAIIDTIEGSGDNDNIDGSSSDGSEGHFFIDEYNTTNDDEARSSIEFDTLTNTLGDPIGTQGFEGDYELTYSDDIVEIIVQFVTPPSVALEIIQEREIRTHRTFSGSSFEEQALSAHDAFISQLSSIATVVGDIGDAHYEQENICNSQQEDDGEQELTREEQFEESSEQNETPFELYEIPVEQQDADARHVEIFSEHHELFNGVYMRVPADMIDSIASLPEVFGVFPNVLYRISTPTPTEFLNATIEASSAAVDANLLPQARAELGIDSITQTGAGVKVAIIDTGIYQGHPVFSRYLVNGKMPGWQFWPANGTDPAPTNPHGTAVASCVIAIAPGVTLMSYRVRVYTDTGISDGGTALGAIEAARRDGAHVINMSFGSPSENTPFNDPLVTASNLAVMGGIVVVAAAGNSGPSSYSVSAPATSPLVITVGAGTAGGTQSAQLGDTVATFSSRGPVAQTYHLKPDIIAPGQGITVASFPSRYAIMSGTSFASPIVAGTAALMRQQFPNFMPNDIKAALMNTARPIANTTANQVYNVGAGFVQPRVALATSAVVSVMHNVPVDTNPNAAFQQRPMASLSYGSIQGPISPTQTINIRNLKQSTRTFTINSTFTRNPGNAGSFVFSNFAVTVAPGSNAQLNAQLFTGFNTPSGFYEGYILIGEGTTLIARLPFAARVTGASGPTLDSIQQFVARLYLQVLGRNYDQAGMQDWTNRLSRGGTGADIASGFFFSSEFAARNVGNEEFVNILYRTLLNREADTSGFAAWTSQLDAGMPREDVFAGFVNSTEFYQLCAQAGIVRGTYTPPPGGMIRVFLTRLYRLALQREPDVVGLNSWTNQLVSGRATGAQVAYGFIFSNEMNNRNLTNEQFVAILYNTLMGRAPDTQGFNNWVGQLNRGASRHSIFVGFVMSVEFYQICRNHGITRGTMS